MYVERIEVKKYELFIKWGTFVFCSEIFCIMIEWCFISRNTTIENYENRVWQIYKTNMLTNKLLNSSPIISNISSIRHQYFENDQRKDCDDQPRNARCQNYQRYRLECSQNVTSLKRIKNNLRRPPTIVIVHRKEQQWSISKKWKQNELHRRHDQIHDDCNGWLSGAETQHGAEDGRCTRRDGWNRKNATENADQYAHDPFQERELEQREVESIQEEVLNSLKYHVCVV